MRQENFNTLVGCIIMLACVGLGVVIGVLS